MRRSTLSMMLGRLERAGLASRTTNPLDARSRIFAITAKGDQVLDILEESIFRIEGAYGAEAAMKWEDSVSAIRRLREEILRYGKAEITRAVP